MDYVELYYELQYGSYPFDTDWQKDKTQKTIDYLRDANISEKEIFKIIEEVPQAEYLSHENLPDWLWENSLLDKEVFYYHKELQIRSSGTKIDMLTLKIDSQPFHLEMKIKYTLHDLLNYFYNTADVDISFMDEKRDLGAMSHLLKQYDKMSFITSVDFLLALIDYAAAEKDCSTSTIFQLDSEFRSEVFELLRNKVAQAEAYKANQIIYR